MHTGVLDPTLSLSMPPTTQLRLAPSDDHHLSSIVTKILQPVFMIYTKHTRFVYYYSNYSGPLTSTSLYWALSLANFPFLVSCAWSSQRCVTCVFSMEPQCLHSLHPVASHSSGSSKDANCLRFAFTIHNIHNSQLWAPPSPMLPR